VVLTPEYRLDTADAAAVVTIGRQREVVVRGAPQYLYAVEVLQQVKGDLPERIEVRSAEPPCDIFDSTAPRVPLDRTTGLLLTRSRDDVWLANACSVISAEELVTVGGEPRGGVIKVVLGVLILGLVLSWALRRRARGARPRLPGAPEP
jgi:MYXO-CTERM domain-containing protein